MWLAGYQQFSCFIKQNTLNALIHFSCSGVDVLQLFHFSLKHSLLKGNTDRLRALILQCCTSCLECPQLGRVTELIHFFCCFLSGTSRGPILIEQLAVISYLHACIIIFFFCSPVCVRVSSAVINPSLVQSMGFQIPWLSCQRWGRSRRE